MTKSSKTINHSQSPLYLLLVIGTSLSLVACSNSESTDQQTISKTDTKAKTIEAIETIIPADRFDLTQWKLTLPTDTDGDGRVDGISRTDLQRYSNEHFFYIDELGHLVFTSPNKGGTTPNSSNTRSELRYMSNITNPSVKAGHPSNNFAVASHPNIDQFASIGGKMEVTMHVDHAPRNSNNLKRSSSFASVIGQIHATKDKASNPAGAGFGNEPLKIFYKKWPNHETGSIYWNYERNLAKQDPDRKDISYLVWGNPKNDTTDPGEFGVALGEDFSYTVNVYQDTMTLTFESPQLGSVKHQINLANNIDANGKVDEKDNPTGYKNAANYFKAGVYNQCRAVAKKSEALPPCPGTGDWEIDKANGDYAQVSFVKLVVSEADPQ